MFSDDFFAGKWNNHTSMQVCNFLMLLFGILGTCFPFGTFFEAMSVWFFMYNLNSQWRGFQTKVKTINTALRKKLCIASHCSWVIFPVVDIMTKANVFTPREGFEYNMFCNCFSKIFISILMFVYATYFSIELDRIVSSFKLNQTKQNQATELIRYVSHEIRAPFNTLSMALDEIKETTKDLELLQLMKTSKKTILRVLDEFNLFAK